MLIKEDLSADLRELNTNLNKLKAVEKFSIFIGVTPPKTNLRLAQQAAIKDFSRVYDELDKAKGAKGSAVPHQDRFDDDLATWLADMKLDDGTTEEINLTCPAGTRSLPFTFTPPLPFST